MLYPLPTPETRDNDTPIPGGFSAAEAVAMQRAVLNLFGRWRITDEQAARLLGDLSTKTIGRWRKGEYGRVGRDLADRMSNILGVHKALRIVFADPGRGYDWVKKPNTDLGGRSALEVMLQGGLMDIVRVRRYLDAARGGW